MGLPARGWLSRRLRATGVLGALVPFTLPDEECHASALSWNQHGGVDEVEQRTRVDPKPEQQNPE
jgi:hypothetical protein